MAPCFDDCGCNKRIYILPAQQQPAVPEYVEYIDDDGDGIDDGALPVGDGNIDGAADGVVARSAGGRRRIVRRRARTNGVTRVVHRVRRPTGFRRGVVGKRVTQGRLVQRRIIRRPTVRHVMSSSEDSESPNLMAL